MKKYVYVFLFLIVVGCGQIEDEIKTDITEPENLEMLAITDGQQYELIPGNYYWETATMVTQTDAASPNQVAEELEPILVEAGTKFQFESKDDPKITVWLWDEKERIQEVSLSNNVLSIPANTEQLIYEVIGKWPNGEVSYTFFVEVK